MDKEFEESRREFLDSVDEDLDFVDEKIRTLTALGGPGMGQIKRKIHSLKGEGGSFDFGILSTLCHRFEDNLYRLERDSVALEACRSELFSMTDQLRRAVKSYRSKENLVLEQIIEPTRSLEKKSIESKVARKRGLIIESSKTVKSLLSRDLAQLNYDISFSADGLEGFTRLLRERFDFILLSYHIGQFNGENVISAIRNTLNPNRDILAILLSNQKCSLISDSDSRNKFVAKDDHVLENISTILSEHFSDGPPKKILLVDDSKDIHLLVKAALKKSGAEIFAVTDGKKVIPAIQAFDPDVVLMDFMLSDCSGADVVAEIQKHGMKVPRVIFFTGKEAAEMESVLKSTHALGMIQKPFQPAELWNQILELWSAKSND